MSPHWTKDLPKESGWYWWNRPEDERWAGAKPYEPEVVFVEDGRFMPPYLDYFTAPRGLFWTERLLPPTP